VRGMHCGTCAREFGGGIGCVDFEFLLFGAFAFYAFRGSFYGFELCVSRERDGELL